MIFCENCSKMVINSGNIVRFKCEVCGNLRFSQFSIQPRLCDVCAVGKKKCQICASSIGVSSDSELDALNGKYRKSEFYSKIKGVSMVPGRQENLTKLISGQELFYLHEKDNPVDPNAIKLFADKDMKFELGYISKDLTPDLLDFMYKHGKKFSVYVSEVTGGGEKTMGCNIKIKIHGVS
jgi:hypothetical protein